MGDYRVVIEAVGGHGCGRDVKEGEMHPCLNPSCPDCVVRAAVDVLRTTGNDVRVARIEHWPVPGAAGTTRPENPGPVDDLITGERKQGQGCNKF